MHYIGCLLSLLIVVTMYLYIINKILIPIVAADFGSISDRIVLPGKIQKCSYYII